MSKCSFLSSQKNTVSCFKDCPFYNYEDNDGECPFKAINNYRSFEKEFFYYKESINLLDELYEEKNLFKIFKRV